MNLFWGVVVWQYVAVILPSSGAAAAAGKEASRSEGFGLFPRTVTALLMPVCLRLVVASHRPTAPPTYGWHGGAQSMWSTPISIILIGEGQPCTTVLIVNVST